MARKIATANDMFDFLSTLSSNASVTVCHMNAVKLKKTKKIRNQETNRINSVIDYEKLGSIIGTNNLVSVISLTKYSGVKWQTHDQFAKDYGNFVNQSNKIRSEFGLKPMQRRKKNIERISFGNDKLTLGKKTNQGKSYVEQNTFDCDKEVLYYGVDRNGDIIGEFNYNEIYKYLDNDRSIGGLSELQKMVKDDNIIDSYIDKVIKLRMEYTQFLNDRILYIIGECDGEKCYFVNDKPTNMIDNINVNLNDIMDYIKVNFYRDFRMMTENKKKYNMAKQIIRLTENDLHKIIKESVKRIIREGNLNEYMGRGTGFMGRGTGFMGQNRSLGMGGLGNRTQQPQQQAQQTQQSQQQAQQTQQPQRRDYSSTPEYQSWEKQYNDYRQGVDNGTMKELPDGKGQSFYSYMRHMNPNLAQEWFGGTDEDYAEDKAEWEKAGKMGSSEPSEEYYRMRTPNLGGFDKYGNKTYRTDSGGHMISQSADDHRTRFGTEF